MRWAKTQGDELKRRFGDPATAAMCGFGERHSLFYGDKKIGKDGCFIGEEPSVCPHLSAEGGKNPLHDPYFLVLTDERPICFGYEHPIDKILKMDSTCDLKVAVTG